MTPAPKTEPGRAYALVTASILDAIRGLGDELSTIEMTLKTHPDYARQIAPEGLGALRGLLDAADEMCVESAALAARLNAQLPRLAMRLKKLRRAVDRAEGD